MTFLEAVETVVKNWGDKRKTVSGGVELVSYGQTAAIVSENGSVAHIGDVDNPARQAFDAALEELMP